MDEVGGAPRTSAGVDADTSIAEAAGRETGAAVRFEDDDVQGAEDEGVRGGRNEASEL